MTHASRLQIPLFAAALLCTPAVSFAAALNAFPATIAVSAGEAFTETVSVSSSDQALNATSGTVTFPTDLLSVSSVSNANSILTLWVEQPTYSNYLGTVTWSGVVPNPGFIGAGGRVLSIRFFAKRAGTATIAFSSSEVLANDGNGTNILTAAHPASVSISSSLPQQSQPSADLLARITSSTHPDQTKWYNLSHVILDWTNARGVTAVRLGYDQNADGVPAVLYTDPISHKELQLNDGIWYFHVQEKEQSVWGPVSTFRIQIDTVPPLLAAPRFPNGTTTAISTIAVQFTATDALSGIDHYVLSVDGNTSEVNAQNGSGVYALPAGGSGTHTLSVTAYDKAGNSASAGGQFAATGEKKPAFLAWSALVWLIANYLSLILIAMAALATVSFAGWHLWHRFHAFRRRSRGRSDPIHRMLRRQFTDLNESVMREARLLEKVRTKRELTQEEERIITNLRKVLEKAESTLEKEMDKATRQNNQGGR